MNTLIRYPKYNYTINELGIYLTLAYNFSDNNIYHISLEQLSRLTDISEKTISKILNKLEKDNLITRTLDNSKSYYYLIEKEDTYNISKDFILNNILSFKVKIFLVLLKPYLIFDKYSNTFVSIMSRRKMCSICKISPVTLNKYLEELLDKGYYKMVNNISYFDYNKIVLDNFEKNDLNSYLKETDNKLIKYINRNNKIDVEIIDKLLKTLTILKNGEE